MAKDQTIRRILVGVTYGQPDTVLRHAAHFARTFGAALICAHVDPGRYVIEERPDGTVVSLPLDPELPELKDTDFDQALVHKYGLRSPTVLCNCLSGSWQAMSRTRSPGWPTSSTLS